jgi:DNA-binding transcriptional LysR family regulator
MSKFAPNMRFFATWASINMNTWNLIRTAHQLAKLGTISATAEALGIHRATVLRHIDALEEESQSKLFQRHARGYIPTEAGEDLMLVAGATEDQFAQLFNRLKQQPEHLSGNFIITSLPLLVPIIIPILKQFQLLHPAIQLQYLTSEKLFRLEFGEAHVAIRSGVKPILPDNVVMPFMRQNLALYAHKEYLEKNGYPNSPALLKEHSFISFADLLPRIPVHKWIIDHIQVKNIVLKTNDPQVLQEAILGGLGIGFMLKNEAQVNDQLIELFPPLKEWFVDHWLVTHGDLHRSAKVQAFLSILRSKI